MTASKGVGLHRAGGPRVHVAAADRGYLADRFRQAAFDLATAAKVMAETAAAMSKSATVAAPSIVDLADAQRYIAEALASLQSMTTPRAKGTK